MNSKKLDATTSIISFLLFYCLMISKIPALIFTAFILAIVKGIQLYVFMNNLSEQRDKEQTIEAKKDDTWKFFVLKLVLELIPLLIIFGAFWILLWRKEVWLPAFTK
jgi:ribose/xylose/arabinose/galactoside ABC-type transport system permease subunit